MSRGTAVSGPPPSGVRPGVLPGHDAAGRGGRSTVRAACPDAVDHISGVGKMVESEE